MFNLPELNYDYGDLEPFFDTETMRIHHLKHHQAYIDNLNIVWEELRKIAPEFAQKGLKKVISKNGSSKLLNFLGKTDEAYAMFQKIQNHGGGHLNHSLFWDILRPPQDGDNLPSVEFLEKIEAKFDTFENFKTIFKKEAISRFGSGWAWLRVDKNGDLIVNSTPNQDYYDAESNEPILGLDIWEHAYYLKYQNRRGEFVDAFWHLVDWRKVEDRYFNVVKGENAPEFYEGACDIWECFYLDSSQAECLEDNSEASNQAVNSQKNRILYTDGSASPNPGPGGFAVIENSKAIFLGDENPSTNIRMEGLAIKAALELLNGDRAEIWTDSKFWIDTLTIWAPNWQKSGWKKKTGEIKNLDIVKPLFEIYQNSNAELKWVKGHSGHKFNELADEWANRAREGEKIR